MLARSSLRVEARTVGTQHNLPQGATKRPRTLHVLFGVTPLRSSQQADAALRPEYSAEHSRAKATAACEQCIHTAAVTSGVRDEARSRVCIVFHVLAIAIASSMCHESLRVPLNDHATCTFEVLLEVSLRVRFRPPPRHRGSGWQESCSGGQHQ